MSQNLNYLNQSQVWLSSLQAIESSYAGEVNPILHCMSNIKIKHIRYASVKYLLSLFS